MEITPEIQAILDAQKAEITASFEESTKGLKESQQKLLAEKKAEQEKQQLLSEEAEAARLAKAAQDKDVTTLSESYELKLAAEREIHATLQAENEKLTSGIKQGKISELANGFVSANIVDDQFSRQAMQGVYSKRLDIREGKTVVLDLEGNLTALSVEDLNKEIMASSIYANHIKSNSSTGGGATGSRTANGVGSTKGKQFSELTAEQKVQHLKDNPPKRTGT
tara:strand:+ start:1226 stop:1894 length:669 start_codon:yes stop_codon:yes gene_type:complete